MEPVTSEFKTDGGQKHLTEFFLLKIMQSDRAKVSKVALFILDPRCALYGYFKKILY